MPNIPIRTHAAVDYLAGILLLLSPLFLPYPDNPTKGIAYAFGAVILLYSSLTDYPLALLRFIPVPIHRGLDLLVGGGLLFAPIHFAVHGAPAVLFVILGVVFVILCFLTRGRFSTTGADNQVIPGLSMSQETRSKE